MFKVKMLRWAAEMEGNWRQAAAMTLQLAWRRYCHREAMQNDDLYHLIRGKRATEISRRRRSSKVGRYELQVPGEAPGLAATDHDGLIGKSAPARNQAVGASTPGAAALDRVAAALEQTTQRLAHLEKEQKQMRADLSQRLAFVA